MGLAFHYNCYECNTLTTGIMNQIELQLQRASNILQEDLSDKPLPCVRLKLYHAWIYQVDYTARNILDCIESILTTETNLNTECETKSISI